MNAVVLRHGVVLVVREPIAIIMLAKFKEEVMTQLLVRDIDDDVVRKLKKRAQQRGHSLQVELKAILEESAQFDYELSWEAVDRIYRKLKASGRTFSDSSALVREDRER
jgi:antitoxin FitA